MWIVLYLGLAGPVNMSLAFNSEADCITWTQTVVAIYREQEMPLRGTFQCVELAQ